jgi:hypothetical protein
MHEVGSHYVKNPENEKKVLSQHNFQANKLNQE